MSSSNNILQSVDASDLTSIKYYGYSIDYITEPNGKRMYLVSKIIDQYNTFNKTNKNYMIISDLNTIKNSWIYYQKKKDSVTTESLNPIKI